MEAECSYDNGNMSITKVSDQEVALFCFAQSDEAAVKISIPRVAVAGLPHDATFDSTVNDAAVALDEQEFMSVRSTVKGRSGDPCLRVRHKHPMRNGRRCFEFQSIVRRTLIGYGNME